MFHFLPVSFAWFGSKEHKVDFVRSFLIDFYSLWTGLIRKTLWIIFFLMKMWTLLWQNSDIIKLQTVYSRRYMSKKRNW